MRIEEVCLAANDQTRRISLTAGQLIQEFLEVARILVRMVVSQPVILLDELVASFDCNLLLMHPTDSAYSAI